MRNNVFDHCVITFFVVGYYSVDNRSEIRNKNPKNENAGNAQKFRNAQSFGDIYYGL